MHRKVLTLTLLISLTTVPYVSAHDGEDHADDAEKTVETRLPTRPDREHPQSVSKPVLEENSSKDPQMRTMELNSGQTADIPKHRARFADLAAEKRQRAVNLDSKLANTNKRMTDAYTRHLTTMETILSKITTRAQILEENGQDISSVTAAVSAAQATIDALRLKLDEQASKDYLVNMSEDLTVGEAIRKAIEDLKTDHRALRDEMIAARKSIQAAFLALKDVAASSVTPTPGEATPVVSDPNSL